MTPETRANGFTWVPYPQRRSRFRGPPPRHERDDDRPLLWLTREKNSDPSESGTSLFLVNDTDEVLQKVSVEGFGFVTIEGEANSLGGPRLVYTNVLPGAAIKVDTYDDFYDLDYMIGFSAVVEGTTFGARDFAVMPKKGGLSETVLWWSSDRNSFSI